MNRVYPFLMSVSLLLSACGGSSSGEIAPGQAPVGGTTPLVISAANSKPVVRVAYGSTLQSMETGGLVGDSGIASSPSGGLQKPQFQDSMSGLLIRAVQKDPLGPITEFCGDTAESGTMTISGEIASITGLTTGDTITVVATDCNEGLGEVINGTMEMTVVSFTGDLLFTGLYRLEMKVLLIDFEVATATDTILSNGDSTVTIDTNGNPVITMSISGISMTTDSMASTEVVSSFLTAQTVDISVVGFEPYTLSASGTINSSQLAGEIVYSTPVTFQGAGVAYPYAGEMLITGANGGTVRLIVLDEINVRIETDADGDGNVDAGGTEDTTWGDITI